MGSSRPRRPKRNPMPEIMDGPTIAAAFAAAVANHADRPFLAVPANAERGYLPAGFQITYGQASLRVQEKAAILPRAAASVGHSVPARPGNPRPPVPPQPSPNTLSRIC